MSADAALSDCHVTRWCGPLLSSSGVLVNQSCQMVLLLVTVLSFWVFFLDMSGGAIVRHWYVSSHCYDSVLCQMVLLWVRVMLVFIVLVQYHASWCCCGSLSRQLSLVWFSIMSAGAVVGHHVSSCSFGLHVMLASVVMTHYHGTG